MLESEMVCFKMLKDTQGKNIQVRVVNKNKHDITLDVLAVLALVRQIL